MTVHGPGTQESIAGARAPTNRCLSLLLCVAAVDIIASVDVVAAVDVGGWPVLLI